MEDDAKKRKGISAAGFCQVLVPCAPSIMESMVMDVHACSVAEPYPTLCDPMDCSLPGSSVHGVSQASVLEWVAISFSRGSSRPRDQTQVSRIAGSTVLSEPPGKHCLAVTACQNSGQNYQHQ